MNRTRTKKKKFEDRADEQSVRDGEGGGRRIKYQEESIDEADRGGADGTKRTIWNRHSDGGYSRARDRRRAIAMVETYQRSWSREPIREVLANIPVYMMWDDHDIRDGWGSWASESPTLAERYPRGEGIFRLYNEWFEDARDVFWHFQRAFYYPFSSGGVSTAIPRDGHALPSRGSRRAMPIAFQCGRLAILILDSRGARDLWREANPVLGDEQWGFIDNYVSNLPSDVDALAIVTTVPIVASAPDNTSQQMLGDRNDDVEYFRRGDFAQIRDLEDKSGPDITTEVLIRGISSGLLAGGRLRDGIARAGRALNWKHTSIDDARDQWCNHFSRPEQEKLIRKAGEARLSNRLRSRPRGVFFIGGDLHSGGLFTVSVDRPDFTAQCLITSGVSQQNDSNAMVGILVDDAFEVAPGIHARLEDYTVIFNFGVSHILFSGGTPLMKNVVARQGDDAYLTLKLT